MLIKHIYIFLQKKNYATVVFIPQLCSKLIMSHTHQSARALSALRSSVSHKAKRFALKKRKNFGEKSEAKEGGVVCDSEEEEKMGKIIL
jgi:hypothetical protein